MIKRVYVYWDEDGFGLLRHGDLNTIEISIFIDEEKHLFNICDGYRSLGSFYANTDVESIQNIIDVIKRMGNYHYDMIEYFLNYVGVDIIPVKINHINF